jgi:integrase
MYIERRRRKLYALHTVPKHLRKVLGKDRFVCSLGTSDMPTAKRLAAARLAMWLTEIARAEAKLNGRPDDVLLQEAAAMLTWLQISGDGGPDDPGPYALSDRAEQIERQHGEATARYYAQVATGRAVPLEEAAEQWLSWRGYTERAEAGHRTYLKLLLKRHRDALEVDRKAAAAFIDEILTPGREPTTVRRAISTMAQLWRYMRRQGLITAENPWTDIGPSVDRSRATSSGNPGLGGAFAKQRRPFTEGEAWTFLQALRWRVDRDVAALVAVTGLRIEEACALLVTDVTDTEQATWLKIRDGKSPAARRRVPVVDPQVRAMLDERLAMVRQRPTEGHARLFHELHADRYGDFSKTLVKRWSKRLKALGMAGQGIVAGHSWRHRARTMAEQGGCPPWTCDFFFGHARPGEGLGRYSAPSEAQLVEVAKTIPLPR